MCSLDSPTFSKDGLAVHCKVEELAGVRRVPPQLNTPKTHTSVQHCAVHLAPVGFRIRVCPTAMPLYLLSARLQRGMLGGPGCWTWLRAGCIPTVGRC